MKRIVFAVVLAVALGAAAYFLLPRAPAVSPPVQPPASLPEPLGGNALREFETWYQAQPRFHLPIPADGATILLAKFTDYQCPACAWTHTAYGPVLANWERRQPGAVKAVSKHYPLDTTCNPVVIRTLHPAACEAAVAVVLARGERRSKLEDWLYANHEALTPATVQQSATRIAGITSLDAGRAAAIEEIRNDAQVGRMLGVTSTPTFFLNGVKLLRGDKLLQPAELDAAIAYEVKHAGPR